MAVAAKGGQGPGDPESGNGTAESGVRFGVSHGSGYVIGGDNVVSSSHIYMVPRSPHIAELLHAVRELRTDLARMAATEHTTGLDEELADAEGELEKAGSIGVGRLVRLRQALAGAALVTAVRASAVALNQLISVVMDDPSASAGPVKPSNPTAGETAPPSPGPVGHTSPGPSTSSDDDEWPE